MKASINKYPIQQLQNLLKKFNDISNIDCIRTIFFKHAGNIVTINGNRLLSENVNRLVLFISK